MNSNPPIVFIHYGDSYYLEVVLKAAIKNNPGKQVFLLGDHENKKYSIYGIKHLMMADFLNTPDVTEFNNVFRFIAGEKFVGGEKWTRFNFLKVFALNNFLLKYHLESIWLFDSDVLITESLKEHEYKFQNYMFSVQNEELMPQGLFNAPDFLTRFTSFIITTFKNEEFINRCKSEFLVYPQYAATYMRFFKEFNDKVEKLNTIPINSIINNETFDRCLFIFFQDGMELYDIQTLQYKIKKVFFYKTGEIFTKIENKDRYIKLITINLSWLPDYIIKRIYKHSQKNKQKKPLFYNYNKMKLMHLNRNEFEKWTRRLMGILSNVKAHLKLT